MKSEDIRAARIRAHLTQVQLAVRAGVSPATVYRCEAGSGETSPATLAALEAALNTQGDPAVPTVTGVPPNT